MSRSLSASLKLLGLTVVLCCFVYPLFLWMVGQTVFPVQAEGSLVKKADGTVVGSLLIAQPFTKDEYFQPRPSAVSYNGAGSGATNWSPSNYLLRDRVARALGPIVKYQSGRRKGELVAPDVEAWFQQDRFQGQPHIVAQWADLHGGLAQAWTKADPGNSDFVDAWAKGHSAKVAQWVKDNPATPEPVAADLAVVFFDDWSTVHPGTFPSAVEHATADGKTEKTIEPVKEGSDVQSIFFDMWRQDHPDADLENVPADMVMASGSGLDPHITLENAQYQLDRVAGAWAKDTRRDPKQVHHEIEDILHSKAFAPWGGLIGVDMVNVLEVNVELNKRYGEPGRPSA